MAITAAQLNVIFNSKGADKVKGDLRDVGGAVSKAGGGFGLLKATALGLGGALLGGLGVGIKAAADLEQQMANFNAAMGGLDAGQLDQMAVAFRRMGAESKFSATEVAAVGEELAKGGFDLSKIEGATQAVINLAQATDTDLMTSVSGISAAMAIWDPAIVGVEDGLTDAAQAADILTVAANKSKADVGDIIAGMRNLGPVAGQMGIGFDEAAAAIAMMTTYGLKGADAGVSLARGLTNLADPTSEATELMTGLGIAAFDMNGEFVGFPALFGQLSSSMKDMDDQTKLMALSTIFGAEAADAMALAIAAGEDPLLAIMEAMEGSGAAAEQSALRMDTLSAQVDTLKEGVVNLLGTWTRGLIPGLRRGVDAANRFVDSLDWMGRRTSALRQAGLNPLAAVVTALGEAFPALQRVTRPLGAALQDLGIHFSRFREMGMNPVMAGLRSLETIFPATARVIEPMIQIAQNLRDAFANLMAGDFGGFLDQMGDVAAIVWDVAVSIGSWAISAVVDLATAIGSWVADNIGTIAATIWDVAVSIGSWAISAANSLWDAIGRWIMGAGGAGSGDTVGGIENGAGFGGGGRQEFSIGAIAVKISDWLVSAAKSVWEAITDWVNGSGEQGVFGASPTGGAGVREPIEFGDPIPIKIGEFEVEIDYMAMYDAINQSFMESTTITPGDLSGIETKGHEVGQAIWNAFSGAISSVFSGGGGGGGAAAFDETGMTGTEGLSAAVNAFIGGMIDEIGASAKEAIQQKWDDLWSDFKLDFPEIQFGESDAPINVEVIPMYTEVKAVVDGFKKLKEEWDGLDWDFTLPDITWPDFPTEVPGWDTLKGAIDAMVAFLKDPWGGPISIPAPDITWPSLPDIPGDWVAWKEKVSGFFDDLFGGSTTDKYGPPSDQMPQTDPGTFNGGGTSGDRFGDLNAGALGRPNIGANAAPGGGQFAGLASGIRDVKAAFDEANGSAGTFAGELDTFTTSATSAATAGQTLGTNLSQGVLNALPVFSAALQGYTLQLTTQSATWAASGTTAGQAAGVGAAQGVLNALPVFAAAMAGYTTVINAEAANMGAAGLNAGSVAGFGVANGIASAQGAIAGEVGAWSGIVNGAAGDLGAAGFNAGAAAGFGVANGLNSALGAVQAAASAIAAAVESAMAAKLKIASPSKVTRQLGEYTGEGFALGIADTLGDVRRASGQLAGAGVPVTSPAYSRYGAGTGTGGGTTTNNEFNVTVQVDASGTNDPEKVAELAATRTMQAIKILVDRERHAQGMVMA